MSKHTERGSVRSFFLARLATVEPGPCLTDWPGFSEGGYPRMKYSGKMVKAVHVAWFHLHGRWARQLNHTCHRPECWNPHHVYEGDQADNGQDRVEAGRSALGERHGNARLTQDDVLAIRARHAAGESLPDIAADYPIGKSNVWAIAMRKTWRHV